MKLSELYTADIHEDGAEINIVNPVTGKKSDVFIKVRGPDSKVFRDAILELNRKQLTDDQASMVKVLAKSTISWRGLVEDDGKTPVEFSPELALTIYEKSPDIANQVMTFISERQNFTKG